MKSLVLLLVMFQVLVFANVKNTKNVNFTLQDKKEQISQREKAYQEYEKQKELENQKLEDDGFCSC